MIYNKGKEVEFVLFFWKSAGLFISDIYLHRWQGSATWWYDG